MTHLFGHLLVEHLDLVIQAQDQNGVTLGEVITPVLSHLTLAEFELGPQGFGTPDGALFIDSGEKKSFVFVEAKQGAYTYCQPRPKTPQELSGLQINIDRLCRENKFNSTINGQLEMRWRFVNALLCARERSSHLVTEQHVNLHPALMSCDRFYWRLYLRPVDNITEHWRRVDMATEHRCLYDLLSQVPPDHFFLLAITDDVEPPDFRNTLRFYDRARREVGTDRRVFWLRRTAIETGLDLR